MRPLTALPLAAALAALAALAACGDSDDRDAFIVRQTSGTVSGSVAPVVQGLWFVYFASEALTGGPGGTPLNADGDALDDVAVALRVDGATEFPLGVATARAAIVGNQVYLDVSEAADGVDWNGVNGATDRVLLHWSQSAGVVTFVETLSPNAGTVPFVRTNDRLYYAAAPAMALAGDETTLSYLERTDPTTPVRVATPMGTGSLDPVLLGIDERLVFAAADETRELVDLNGDGDSMDPFVLWLLDGTNRDARLVNVGLALEGPGAPFAARAIVAGDWDVAFLVDEGDQGGVDLNAFGASACPGSCPEDGDAADQVLHHLRFLDFVAGMSPPTNTGIAGRDRVVLAEDGVATLSDEADESCDLNCDGDTADTMARGVRLSTSTPFPSTAPGFWPVATTIPGGAMGLSELEDRFVCVVDESADPRDADGKPVDHDLVAWLDPEGDLSTWTFQHRDPGNPGIGTGLNEDVTGDGIGDPGLGAPEPFAGTTWFGAVDDWSRLPLSFEERVPGLNINTNLRCGFVWKDNDATDALPAWTNFIGNTLDFDGLGFALDPANAGLRLAAGFVFYRVSEQADNVDHDGDGTIGGVVLMRNPITFCGPSVMAVSSNVPGPAVFTEGEIGAAFFSDETLAGRDYNDDGDAMDLVVRYFNF